MRVAIDKSGDAGGKREATVRRKVESRGRKVGRIVRIGRTIERRSSCVAARVSSRRTRDSRLARRGAMRLVRVLVQRGGMIEEDPCYSQSAVRLRVQRLVVVIVSYPSCIDFRDFLLVCHVCVVHG